MTTMKKGNTRTWTPAERLAAVSSIAKGRETAADVSRRLGVTPDTVYQWQTRYRAQAAKAGGNIRSASRMTVPIPSDDLAAENARLKELIGTLVFQMWTGGSITTEMFRHLLQPTAETSQPTIPEVLPPQAHANGSGAHLPQ